MELVLTSRDTRLLESLTLEMNHLQLPRRGQSYSRSGQGHHQWSEAMEVQAEHV